MVLPRMTSSYVGIITRRGLEFFLPETKHAARFLLRRASRLSFAPAVCYWAVLRDSHAARIRWMLHEGNSLEALNILQFAATSLGTLLDSEPNHDRLWME